MKRVVFILCLLASSVAVNAQSGIKSKDVIYRTGAPSSCIEGKIIVDRVTGTAYVRVSGACQAVGAGVTSSRAVNTTSPITGGGDLSADRTIACATCTTATNTQTLTNKTLTAPVINSPTGIVKGDVGLGNVDNTADTAKPVSTAQQTALDLKANLASPTFTGTPSLPTGTTGVTQSAGDSSTKLATTAFVTTADNLKANLAGGNTWSGTQTFGGDIGLAANKITFTNGILRGTNTTSIGVRNAADGDYAPFRAGKLWLSDTSDNIKFSIGQLDAYSVELTSGGYFSWSNSATQSNGGSKDTSLSRNAAGILQVGTGAANASGAIRATRHETAASVFWSSGSGSPESVVTANVGSLYTRTDGGAGTTLYVKESGTGNTGWVAK